MGIEYRLLFLELNTSFTESNTSQKNLSYCSLSSSSSNTHLHLQSLCSLSMNLIYHTQDLFLILLNSNKHSCNVKTIRVCQNNKGKWLAQCVFSITNALGIDSLLVIGQNRICQHGELQNYQRANETLYPPFLQISSRVMENFFIQ